MLQKLLLGTGAPPASKDRFPALTGFRGICILWVVFVHVNYEWGPLIDSFRDRWGIGVDFFFAISGFLVTRSLLQCAKAAQGKPNPKLTAAKDFALRRVSRILPPYLALLAFVAALALLVDRNLYERLTAIAWALPSFLFVFPNYTVGMIRTEVPEILAALWSIGFQEQFYLVLLICFSLSPKRLPQTLLGLGLLSLVIRLVYVFFVWPPEGHSAQLQMWLHLRFDAISWSCLACIYFDRLGILWSTPSRARVTNALAMLSLAAVLAAHTWIPGDRAQAMIYCFKGIVLALVIRAICELRFDVKGIFGSILRTVALRRVGTIAYEIYLLNAVMIAALPRIGVAHGPLNVVLAFVLTYLGASLFYELFSRPVQDWIKGKSLGNDAKIAQPGVVRAPSQA